MLDLFRQARMFAELFLRHRRDTSALARVMRRLHWELCRDLASHLQLSAALGFVVPLCRLQLQAELILAQVLVGGEATLDRRFPAETIAEELTLFITAATQAVVESAGK